MYVYTAWLPGHPIKQCPESCSWRIKPVTETSWTRFFSRSPASPDHCPSHSERSWPLRCKHSQVSALKSSVSSAAHDAISSGACRQDPGPSPSLQPCLSTSTPDAIHYCRRRRPGSRRLCTTSWLFAVWVSPVVASFVTTRAKAGDVGESAQPPANILTATLRLFSTLCS